jgi:hypothetical protein
MMRQIITTTFLAALFCLTSCGSESSNQQAPEDSCEFYCSAYWEKARTCFPDVFTDSEIDGFIAGCPGRTRAENYADGMDEETGNLWCYEMGTAIEAETCDAFSARLGA